MSVGHLVRCRELKAQTSSLCLRFLASNRFAWQIRWRSCVAAPQAAVASALNLKYSSIESVSRIRFQPSASMW